MEGGRKGMCTSVPDFGVCHREARMTPGVKEVITGGYIIVKGKVRRCRGNVRSGGLDKPAISWLAWSPSEFERG